MNKKNSKQKEKDGIKNEETKKHKKTYKKRKAWVFCTKLVRMQIPIIQMRKSLRKREYKEL